MTDCERYMFSAHLVHGLLLPWAEGRSRVLLTVDGKEARAEGGAAVWDGGSLPFDPAVLKDVVHGGDGGVDVTFDGARLHLEFRRPVYTLPDSSLGWDVFKTLSPAFWEGALPLFKDGVFVERGNHSDKLAFLPDTQGRRRLGHFLYHSLMRRLHHMLYREKNFAEWLEHIQHRWKPGVFELLGSDALVAVHAEINAGGDGTTAFCRELGRMNSLAGGPDSAADYLLRMLERLKAEGRPLEGKESAGLPWTEDIAFVETSAGTLTLTYRWREE